jgi:acetyl-CoA synthetase
VATDPATLMFTSGTTSEPKACVIPQSGFLSLIPFVEHTFGVGTGDLLFATSDPGWSYGLYTSGCAPMSLGVPRIISTGDFDPGDWLRLMAEHDVTVAVGAPTAFRRLPAAARRYGWPETLRASSTAGEALDPETVTEFAERGTELRDGYGLTEVGMVLANQVGHPEGIDPAWLHGPVPGFEVELRRDDGTPADVGEDGALAIRRPRFQLSLTYENAPGTWEERWQDGWFVTDDLFRRDERGRFQFRGRADDVIVTSGYNVGPIEVESILLADPAILEAAVVAEPDPDRGAVVRAVVVRAPDAPDEATLNARLQAAVKEQVGRHAYPRVIEYADSLPRTATGKLRRTDLR